MAKEPLERWMVCQDCLDVFDYLEFGDDLFLADGVDYTKAKSGVARLNLFTKEEYPKVVSKIAATGNHDEFSWRQCECCMSRLGGKRYEFGMFAVGGGDMDG